MDADDYREAMVRCLLKEHERLVRSEHETGRITEYFAGVGWGWALMEAGVEEYSEAARRRHPGLLNWCGIGVGWAGLQVGYHLGDQCRPVRLDPLLAKHVLPSTYRADKRADDPEQWAKAGHTPPDRPDDIQRADIICIVTGSGKEYGDHFAMVTDVDGDDIHTVEANGYGRRGDGTEGRGVVRTVRQRDDVRRVIRLTDEHFEVVDL